MIIVSGWWLGHPPEKYGPSIGMISNPIYAKIKNGNQTTNQSWNMMKYWWNTDQRLYMTKLWLRLTCGRPAEYSSLTHGWSLSLWRLRWPKGHMCRSSPPDGTAESAPEICFWRITATWSPDPSIFSNLTVRDGWKKLQDLQSYICGEISRWDWKVQGCDHCSARCLSISWGVVNVRGLVGGRVLCSTVETATTLHFGQMRRSSASVKDQNTCWVTNRNTNEWNIPSTQVTTFEPFGETALWLKTDLG